MKSLFGTLTIPVGLSSKVLECPLGFHGALAWITAVNTVDEPFLHFVDQVSQGADSWSGRVTYVLSFDNTAAGPIDIKFILLVSDEDVPHTVYSGM